MAGPFLVDVAPARFAEVAPQVAAIERRTVEADGHPALGDAIRRDLERPGGDSAGFLFGDAAYAHIARSDNLKARHWVLGLAIDPAAREPGTLTALVTAALAHVSAHGGGLVACWRLGATDADDAEFVAAGMTPVRDLYEMRVPLPLTGAPTPPIPPGFTVRTFEVGNDERAWLDVNNRAFAAHEEQGDWTEATLARREAEPWFDPSIFFLAFDDAGLAGFNWCKIHEARGRDPRLGEIFVIGVDPRTQGTGLGRALALYGLDALAERGIDTGMLFCAADNAPALALYRKLGFTVHRVDRAYETEVSAQ